MNIKQKYHLSYIHCINKKINIQFLRNNLNEFLMGAHINCHACSSKYEYLWATTVHQVIFYTGNLITLLLEYVVNTAVFTQLIIQLLLCKPSTR